MWMLPSIAELMSSPVLENVTLQEGGECDKVNGTETVSSLLQSCTHLRFSIISQKISFSAPFDCYSSRGSFIAKVPTNQATFSETAIGLRTAILDLKLCFLVRAPIFALQQKMGHENVIPM